MKQVRDTLWRRISIWFNAYPDYRDELRKWLLGYSINSRLGRILKKARLNAGKSLRESAPVAGLRWTQLLFIEHGWESVPLCSLLRLAEFYHDDVYGFALEVNAIMFEKYELASKLRVNAPLESAELNIWIHNDWHDTQTPLLLQSITYAIGFIVLFVTIQRRVQRRRIGIT